MLAADVWVDGKQQFVSLFVCLSMLAVFKSEFEFEIEIGIEMWRIKSRGKKKKKLG